MRNKKVLIISGAIAILLIVIALITVLLFSRKDKNEIKEEEKKINVEELETNFSKIFTNGRNEYVNKLYNIEEKSSKYKIEANVPYVKISDKIDNEINKEINDTFVNKILQVYNESKNYTILTMDYGTSVNGNIVSLMIKFILKEDANAQRTIIKTYNYDIEKGKLIQVTDLIKEQDKAKIQEQITEKIGKEIKREQTIIEQGYQVYRRNQNDPMYLLENATEFYIENDILYIIYSYGNSNYTGEIDLIITKI